MIDLAKTLDLAANPVASAKHAGLRYIGDDKPGLTRKKRGRDFAYFDAKGRAVRDHNTLIRIKRLAIPPAWKDVWICPFDDCHLQATGRDARGRKQYRYHHDWRAVRDETKYEKMLAFGQALPVIRQRVQRDLALPGLPREKVLATVVRLLETTLIRVGNDEYAKENRSYGLTTMKNRHVDVAGAKMKFTFRGKSGKAHEISVYDKHLARIVRRCRELPGQELFAYVDENGEPHDVTSTDVNDYLREIAGDDFTAKDFRTWAGTKLAAMALQEFKKFDTEKQAKRNVVQAIEAVAKMLGNTPAICRKCYVHPAVLDSYLDGTLADVLQRKAGRKLARELKKLKPAEAAVMMLLHQRLKKASRR